jgi:hypothetical protein
VEELDFVTENFEDALVIDATITNVEANHTIWISRTYPFEEDGPIPESGATVIVVGNGTEYVFREGDAGMYTSEITFAAQPTINYQLKVTTQNGRSYSSSVTQLTPVTEIERVYAVRETNDDGVNGMSIFVDTFDPTGNSKYYRYEYEETFKVQPPSFVSQDLVEDFNPSELEPCLDCVVKFVERSQDKLVCYRTETSQNTNLANTSELTEDRVSRHLTRFMSSQDYRISHRYSILVKQFVQSMESYRYLEALSRFSGEGSLFSQVQPGFLASNILSESNPEETVIGFFEVASVSTKRIFFNYDQYYPNEPLPPYINSCQLQAPTGCTATGINSYSCGGLLVGLRNNTIVYKGMNTGQFPFGGPYLMVDRECGDCTALGVIEPPDFWVE